MNEPLDALEVTLGRVLRAGVKLSSVTLGAGLVSALLLGGGALARALLASGVVLLVGTPVARVVMATIGYARRRDWLYVVLTSIVLAELIASVLAVVMGRASG